jgi:hypothetical protein
MIILPILLYYYALIQSGNTSPEIIKDYAVAQSIARGVDPQKVTGILNGESKFIVPTKQHYHDGKKKGKWCNSNGPAQIRDCDHPEVTITQANDPIFAINFIIDNIDKCKTWWLATCPASGSE